MGPKGVGYALGAAWLFGASTPAAKLLLRHISPLMLSALLYLGAALALSLYGLVRSSASRETELNRGDLPFLAGMIFFGGMAGPVLMLVGLQRVSALAGSLLLNLENPFTLLIAVGLMREHLGRREAFAAGAIMFGGVLITVEPGYLEGSFVGVLEIVGACLSWAIDNNLTQRISSRDPVAVARLKSLLAGSGLAAIALVQGTKAIPAVDLLWAGVVGALCYGASIVFDVKALRVLGAARESAYFATAPFVGALLSIVIFRELPSVAEIAGVIFMVLGVSILIRERHAHLHKHDSIFHEHMHLHDEHHQHEHQGIPVTEPHSHPHLHSPITHDHLHVSDVHHRHSHRSR